MGEMSMAAHPRRASLALWAAGYSSVSAVSVARCQTFSTTMRSDAARSPSSSPFRRSWEV